MNNKFYKLIFLVAFSLSLFTNSCDVLEGVNLFTKEDDVRLGYDIDQEIRNNPGEYPIYYGDPTVKLYIEQRIFNHILASAKVENKNVFPYELEIIDDPNVLNAFCVPGGYIYLYTGLLLYLDSEAALAGVIGHEIAHAELRHTTQRLTAYYGTSILLGMILGENPAALAEIAANLFVGLAFLANSRYDEDRSDEESFEYLKDTRYYPGGIKFFFEKLEYDGLVGT
ncbi:MAG: M48 family metalloprotease, partial [Ignavibacteriaceae bacterium]|nr:M48 family metalloprotease [Ignavibacteriaceae bacterium]